MARESGVRQNVHVSAPPATETPPASGGRRPFEHYLVLGAALAALVMMLVLALVISPDERGFGTHEQFGLPACKTMAWFHVPCPGCGVTTALTHALHGEFAASFETQPLGILVAILIPLVALWALVGHLRGRDLQRAIYRLSLTRWLALSGVIVLLVWVMQVRKFLGTG